MGLYTDLKENSNFPKNMDLKITIVILNWNRFEDTKECLLSLSKIDQPDFKLDVLVVDNGSEKSQISKLEKYVNSFTSNFFLVALIKNNKNFGYAKGNNVGIQIAIDKASDYVLVINNDTQVKEDFLNKLLNVANKDPKIGALTPKIYFAKGYEFHKSRYKNEDLGRVIWSAGGDIDWNNVYGSNHGVDEVDNGQFNKHKNTDFATGACVLYKKEALLESGLFDERYFLYLEDTDLSMRIKNKGFKIAYVPDAIIWHKVAQSSSIGSDLNDYFITRNRLLFGFTYSSTRAKLALFKESIRFLISGRKWQKKGVIDFYLRKFGKGSWGK